MAAPAIASPFLIFFSSFALAQSERLPLVQRAYVIQNQAIIYEKPDFDSSQLGLLPRNRIIAISTKVYRPKNLFGSFYRVFVNKPKKIRGYVSEVDVVAQFKRAAGGFQLNPVYQAKENVLKKVKEEILTEQTKKMIKSKAPPPAVKKEKAKKKKEKKKKEGFIGLSLGWHLPLFAVSLQKTPKWFGLQGIRFIQTKKKKIPLDLRLSFSLQAPPTPVNNAKVERGRMIEGHILPLFSIVKNKDHWLSFGLGLAFRSDHAAVPSVQSQLRMGPGLQLSSLVMAFPSWHIKMSFEYHWFLAPRVQSAGLWGGVLYSF